MILTDPFFEYSFMQRALLGSLLMSIGAVPVGTFMTLKKMSLTGDAMSHAILPGIAIAYLLSSGSLVWMTIGGVLAGFLVAGLSGLVARNTHIKEDTSLAAFYLISLSLGVFIISLHGNKLDLFHVLFGNILALDNLALFLLFIICSISILIISILYRVMIMECVDPLFLRQYGRLSSFTYYILISLVIINLISGFHALGTLMSIGIMILPAATARFWVKKLDHILIISVISSFFCCYLGLLISYYFNVPTGPTIILLVGILYILSLLIGLNGGYLIKKISVKRNYHLEY